MIKTIIKMLLSANLTALFPALLGFLFFENYIANGFYFLSGMLLLVANFVGLVYGNYYYKCWKEENRILKENEEYYNRMQKN